MRALQIALGIACLAVVYSAVAPIVGAAAITAARVPPVGPPPPPEGDFSKYDVIASRNLFHARSTDSGPSDEPLKESELRLKLCGTFAANDPAHSVACIDDQTSQKKRAYRAGESITDGVKLVSVERRRAVIDNRGSLEQLSMEEDKAAGAILPNAKPKRPASAAPAIAGPEPKLSDRLKDLKEQQRLNDVVRPKLQDVLNNAQLSPVYNEQGQFGGMKLTNIRPGGPFTGMADGSVCFELNGNKIDGVQQLPQALLSMGSGQTCLKCRQPDGTETTRCL